MMASYILIYVLIAALWVLYFVWFKEYMQDYTRQELFKLRDELFDYAADGQIAFDDEAYLTTRTLINGVIRFTHSISLTHWLMMLLCSDANEKHYAKQFSIRFSAAIAKLNPNQQAMIHKTMFKTHSTVFNHFLNTSPLLFVTIKPLFDLAIVIKVIKKSIIEDFCIWNPIDAQADFVGRKLTTMQFA